jgi:serine/threonine protein phosphatase PrpC
MSINQEETIFQIAQQTAEVQDKTTRLTLQLGWDTDLGGVPVGKDADGKPTNFDIYGRAVKPNQDRKIMVPFLEHDGCLIGMADGHGTRSEEVAELCEKIMIELIETKMERILINPVEFLEFAFDYIHGEIIKTYTCGTTFSIIIVLGKKMWIANVGDSTGILCAKHPIFNRSHLAFEKDLGIPEKMYETKKADDDKLSNYIILTSEDHSAEDPEEYKRMRAFKSSEENPHHAELICVYDKQGRTKTLCPHVFNISEDGTPTVRPDDESFEYYFKNVRREKAAYVCSRGQLALAGTRSLGDIELHNLGLTHKPIIRSMDLNKVFEDLRAAIKDSKEKTAQARGSEAAGGGPAEEIPEPNTICVVLASDGVWDNWIYDHVQKFVMDKSCLKAIETDKVFGAQRVCKSFMLRNQTFGRKHFGNSSDNATGIVMYITEE